MRVLMLANRKSGKGKAAALADRIARELEREGHRVTMVQPGAPAPPGTAKETGFDGVDAVVAVGGDGTIHYALPELLRTGAPIYHAPGGNENLFAREFGMTGEPTHVLCALERRPGAPVDVGTVNGAPFAILVSVGPDAGVIHRLHAVRSRASGHAMYLKPILAECREPSLPELTIVVEGKAIVTNQRGFVMIANCQRYALGLDPARVADMRDGRLDVVFFPARTIAHALVWVARCAIGAPTDWPGVVTARGADIMLTSTTPAPRQVDGEAGGWLEPGESLRLGVLPGALRVLGV
ncbi:MAG: diacylglycerol kinase family protein [Planctomycetota bacterium]|nr:diacylglycerol kinase family protein [Planctomycetota bacterium]